MTNEAADDLRKYATEAGEEYWVTLLDEALATERRLTVERVREGIVAFDSGIPMEVLPVLHAILDDISKEGTP